MSPNPRCHHQGRGRFPRVSGDEPRHRPPYFLDFCFPRVSGDEPTVTYITDTNTEFSPRERG